MNAQPPVVRTGQRGRPALVFKNVRTSVSLAIVIWDHAEERMRARGFNSFSSYIASLIRDDEEKPLKKKRA